MYNYLLCHKFDFHKKKIIPETNQISKVESGTGTETDSERKNPLPTYMISVFDDGNGKYEQLENKWFITGNPVPGKVSLLHKNSSTSIKSISAWKVQLIEKENTNKK